MTKALVLGDFGSAIFPYLFAEQYLNTILFAMKRGPELLNNTQRAYFEKCMVNPPECHLQWRAAHQRFLEMTLATFLCFRCLFKAGKASRGEKEGACLIWKEGTGK